jgi:hypothetical protein
MCPAQRGIWCTVLGEWVAFDSLVHPWLGEARLVGLVVPVAPVADDINDDILLVLRTVISRELTNKRDGLCVVTVDVEDRCVDGFGNIGRIWRRSRETRVGREANLIIDDEVDCAASAIAREIVEAHSFIDDALSCESSIAVKQTPMAVVWLASSFSKNWIARVFPRTTGSQVSKCDGLATRDSETFLPDGVGRM